MFWFGGIVSLHLIPNAFLIVFEATTAPALILVNTQNPGFLRISRQAVAGRTPKHMVSITGMH
jgi:hypothetical protein